MPTVREYRVMMPLSLEEFHRARLWHKNEQMKLEIKLLQSDRVDVTEFGERILLREQTAVVPSFSTDSSIAHEIQADHLIKGYGSSSQCSIPTPMAFFATAGSFVDIIITDNIQLTEVESWEAYPFFRSVSSNSSLGSRYRMTIEGNCISGFTTEENPLNLLEPLLKTRKVVSIDIAKDVAAGDYRDGKDPILFISKKTGRGRLEPGKWMEEMQPCLSCCILINIQFDFLGPLGSFCERKLHNGIVRALTLHHRELFCCIDEWFDLPLSELQNAGKELQDELEQVVAAKVKTNGMEQEIEQPVQTETVLVNNCPLNAIKTWAGGICCTLSAGGSVGYFYLKLGFLLSILSFFVTYFFMKVYNT